eukprot:scpid27654/ scgid19215/ 
MARVDSQCAAHTTDIVHDAPECASNLKMLCLHNFWLMHNARSHIHMHFHDKHTCKVKNRSKYPHRVLLVSNSNSFDANLTISCLTTSSQASEIAIIEFLQEAKKREQKLAWEQLSLQYFRTRQDGPN